MKALVVGAGFSGCIAADQLAQNGFDVLVIDKRVHIAGNAYDRNDEHGILIHEYGPHAFHTNSTKIVEYLSRFTSWLPYEHHTLSSVNGKLFSIPLNLDTINSLYGTSLDEEGLKVFFENVREKKNKIVTSEDFLLNKIGRNLMDIFYSGYGRKQWGMPLSELDASVVARIPIRTNRDSRYFTDKFQGVPEYGYTKMFSNMLTHPRIRVELCRSFSRSMEKPYDLTVYTGALDDYFEHALGKLPYRSLKFKHEYHKTERYQEAPSVVFPSASVPYTRVTEHKYLTGQKHSGTTVSFEYPTAEGDPYYPVPHSRNKELYRRYEGMAASLPKFLPIGRLAQYQYLNMDQAAGSALSKIGHYLGRLR